MLHRRLIYRVRYVSNSRRLTTTGERCDAFVPKDLSQEHKKNENLDSEMNDSSGGGMKLGKWAWLEWFLAMSASAAATAIHVGTWMRLTPPTPGCQA